MAEDEAKYDALFVNLVLVFKNAALQQMGKLVNPLTGKVERNLEQARFSIDTLDMLKAKTAGNLSQELERLLDTTLLELRMNYVDEVEREAKEKEQAKEKEDKKAQAQAAEAKQEQKKDQAEEVKQEAESGVASAVNAETKASEEAQTRPASGQRKRRKSRSKKSAKNG